MSATTDVNKMLVTQRKVRLFLLGVMGGGSGQAVEKRY